MFWSEILEPVSKRQKLSEDAVYLHRFFTEFSSAVLHDNVITFSSDIFGRVGFGRNLFIRSCYDELLQKTLTLRDNGLFRTVITGTPGIGKTFFGAFCLYRIASEFPSLIYHTSDLIVSIELGVVCSISFDDLVQCVMNTKYLYIADGVKPALTANCFTILVTSPRFSIFKEFIKERNTTSVLYMPPWTYEELEHVNAFLKLRTTEELSFLFSRFGGVPRYVLSPQPIHEEIAFLRGTIAQFTGNFNDILCAFGNQYVDKDVFRISNLLLHLIPSEDFKSSQMHWASKYIASEVFQRHHIGLVQSVKQFIASASSSPEFATSRGLLFEPIVHNFLPTYSGSMVSLTNRAQVDISMVEYQMREFTNLSSLPIVSTGQYYVPSVGNLPAGDSFAIILNQLCIFQITVSKSHPIRGDCLLQLIKAIREKMSPNISEGLSARNRLVFVVPNDIASEYQQQRLINSKGIAYQRPPAGLQNVDQFVIGINMEA